jgi:urease accessory protein
VIDDVATADGERIFAANRAVGRIVLTAEAAAGVTRRSRVREEGSLRVRFPGPPSPELEAVIVNTGGGVAGGDRHELAFTAGAGARLLVTSAAAEKVYRSRGPDATISVRLEVGARGSLAWVPQETILFDRAQVVRAIEIDAAADARLVVAEAVVFGRSGMGEAVEHGRFVDRWRVRRAGRLVYADTLRLDGAIADKLRQPAVAGGGIAIATVLVMPGDEATVAPLRAVVDEFHGEVGMSAWNGFAVVRLCAQDGARLRRDLLTVLTVLRGDPLPRLWLN